MKVKDLRPVELLKLVDKMVHLTPASCGVRNIILVLQN